MIKTRKSMNGTRYQARVLVNGRPRYGTFATFQEADKWVNEMRYKRDKRITVINHVGIEKMWEEFNATATNKGNAFSYLKKTKCLYAKYLKPFYGDFDMATVTIQEHKALIQYLQAQNLSKDPRQKRHLTPASINRVRSLISAMYNVAIREGLFGDHVTGNPFNIIRPMREMNLRFNYWDAESVRNFLISERDSRYYPLWALMLNTGLRIGEAVALHGEQIDRVADIITVDRIFCIASNRVLNVTKSCRLRQIGMNDAVKAALETNFRNGPLFTTQEGNPLRSDYVIKTVFPRACKKAGAKHIGCHGLRHTYASHFMMNGGNVYDLQKILGHRDVKTTERYAHLSKDHIKRKSAIVSFTGNLIAVDFKKTA